MKESDNLLLLHSQIRECDSVLAQMETLLSGFQVRTPAARPTPSLLCGFTPGQHLPPRTSGLQLFLHSVVDWPSTGQSGPAKVLHVRSVKPPRTWLSLSQLSWWLHVRRT